MVKPSVNRRECIGKAGVLLSDIYLQTDPKRGYHFTVREFPKRVREILALDPLA